MVLSAAWLLSGPAANAQDQTQNQVQQAPASPSISDEKLNAAAAAMEHVADIRQQYQQQLTAAPPSEQQRIVGEANNALTKAVTDQGLSVEEYTSIMKVAQADPAVRQKLLDRVHPSGQ
jgi:predicted ATPase with chaperone activity